MRIQFENKMTKKKQKLFALLFITKSFYDLLDQHLKYMEAHLQNNKNEVINQQVERLVSIVFIQLKVNFE